MKGPFRVGLLLTERCDIACAHCWLEPNSNGADMSLDEARDYIDQASRIPTVKWISFTGGEPFLLPGLLNELVGYASAKGLRTECVTNCSWAETPEKTEETLKILKESGLDVVNISADDFHQEFVPFENVLNCFEAAKSLGLKTVIMSAAQAGGSLRLAEIINLLGPEEIGIWGEGESTEGLSAIAVETGFIPVGRGAALPRDRWLIGESQTEGPCRLVLRDIGIDPKGKLLACCSAASLLARGRLGSVVETRIRQLLDDACEQPLFKILSEQGPSSLADSLGIRWREGFVSRCHLCHEVLKDPRLDEALV
jgi:pyruvate-formate lyase-activating enzyme